MTYDYARGLSFLAWVEENQPDGWTRHPAYPAWVEAMRAQGVDCKPGHTRTAVGHAITEGKLDPDYVKSLFTLLFL